MTEQIVVLIVGSGGKTTVIERIPQQKEDKPTSKRDHVLGDSWGINPMDDQR